MKNMVFFVVTCSFIILAGCSDPSKDLASAEVDESSSVALEVVEIQILLSNADSVYETAKEKEHAWIITSRLLASARENLLVGDEEAAMADAKRALFTAEASVLQANKPDSDWQARVPR